MGRLSEMLLDARCTQEIRRIWGAWLLCRLLRCMCCVAFGAALHIAHDAAAWPHCTEVTCDVLLCSWLHEPVRRHARQEAGGQAEAALCAVRGFCLRGTGACQPSEARICRCELCITV